MSNKIRGIWISAACAALLVGCGGGGDTGSTANGNTNGGSSNSTTSGGTSGGSTSNAASLAQCFDLSAYNTPGKLTYSLDITTETIFSDRASPAPSTLTEKRTITYPVTYDGHQVAEEKMELFVSQSSQNALSTSTFYFSTSGQNTLNYYAVINDNTYSTITYKYSPAITYDYSTVLQNQTKYFSQFSTTATTYNKSSGATSTNSWTESPIVTFIGFEDLTIASGTYKTCKVTGDPNASTSMTIWYLANHHYGIVIKSETIAAGTKQTHTAKSISINGLPI